MNASGTPDGDQPESGEEYYPRAAPVMVGLTLVMFLAMMALLGYRWVKIPEPNGFVLVQGNKQFDGAEITVTDSTGEMHSHGTLNWRNEYSMRFPLPQGTYRVLITLDGKVIVRQPVALREGTGLFFNLAKDAATQSADESAATEPSIE